MLVLNYLSGRFLKGFWPGISAFRSSFALATDRLKKYILKFWVELFFRLLFRVFQEDWVSIFFVAAINCALVSGSVEACPAVSLTTKSDMDNC